MKKTVKKTALLSLFAALSLIIFAVEAAIPPIIPIAGVKLGLANVVTLFLLQNADVRSAAAVLFVRILLSAIFAGQPSAIIYSVCGGVLALAAMYVINRLLHGEPVWFISAAGGAAHNLGQLAAACVLVSRAALAYLPYLLISGCIAGALTGLLTGFLTDKMKKAGILDKMTAMLNNKGNG